MNVLSELRGIFENVLMGEDKKNGRIIILENDVDDRPHTTRHLCMSKWEVSGDKKAGVWERENIL